MKAIALGSLGVILLAGGLTAWSYYVQRSTHEELLAIREAITPGMTRDQAFAAIRPRLRHTRLVPGDGVPAMILVQDAWAPLGWVLCISFNQNRAVAVRIGTGDSLFDRPKSAPPDRVWGQEAGGSPGSHVGAPLPFH